MWGLLDSGAGRSEPDEGVKRDATVQDATQPLPLSEEPSSTQRSKFIQIAGEALLSAADDTQAGAAAAASAHSQGEEGEAAVRRRAAKPQQPQRLPTFGKISDTGAVCITLALALQWSVA